MDTPPQPLIHEQKHGFWRRLIDGGYVNEPACDLAFERMHRQDPLGDRLHLLFACLGLLVFFGPVTVSELAFAPLTVFFVVRIFNTFPVWVHGFGQPVVLAVIALGTWMMLSLLWSDDPLNGWREISELRWFVLVGLFFPVIEQREKLIAALCVGLAIGQLGQVADAFDGFGVGWLAEHVEHHPGRIGGWWQPVVGGTMLVAGLGLHLPAAILGTGRSRTLGLIGSTTVGIGILATGSRGAWIAGTMLLGLVMLFGLLAGWIRWKRVALLVGCAGLVMAVGALALGDGLTNRLNETKVELNEIINGQYDSYTGQRVRMGKVAIAAIQEHPIRGIGAGNFQHWGNRHDPEQGIFAHAHNGLLHLWSTLGLIGVLLWTLTLTIMLRSAWRWRDPSRVHIYRIAPFFAIIGLILASITDVPQLNTQSAALLAILAALSPSISPGHRQWARNKDNPPIR